MEPTPLWTLLVVSVLLGVSRAEFCHSYYQVVEASRAKVSGFKCPQRIERPEDNNNVYCCGSPTDKYCCDDCRKSLNKRACLTGVLHSSDLSVGAIIGITMGSTFVGLGCIYFGCCMFYTLFPRKTLTVGSRIGSFQQSTPIYPRKPASSDRTSAPRTKLLTTENGTVANGHHRSTNKPSKVNGCPGSEPLLHPRNGSVEGPGCVASKVVIVIDCPSPSPSTSKETVIDFPGTNSEASQSRKSSVESAV